MICQSCGAEIPGGVNFCTYCGAEQKPIDLKVCKKCNYSNRADDVNCKKCGSNLAVEGTDYIFIKTGAPVDASSAQPAQQPQSQAVPPKQAHKPVAPVLPPFGMDKKAAGVSAPRAPIPPVAQQAQGRPSPPVPVMKPNVPPPQKPQVSSSPVPPSPQFPQINHPQIPQVPGQQVPGVRQAAPVAPQQKPISTAHPQPQTGMASAPITSSGNANIPPAAPLRMETPVVTQAGAVSAQGVVPTEISGQFLFCDICGAKNEAELSECKYCKSPLKKTGVSPAPVQHQEAVFQPESNILPPVLSSKPSEEKITGTKGKICRKCNTENPAMMLICYNCGEPLEEEKPVQKLPSPSTVGQEFSGQPLIPQPISQTSSPSGIPLPIAAGEPLTGAKGEVSKKICPKCGTPNLLGSTVCGHCGFQFKNEGAFSDDTETKPFLVCPKCYFRNAVDATECAKCHTTLKILPNVKSKGPADFPVIGESTVKCPVCGVDNPREVLSCKNCNYNFLKKKQEVIQVAPPQIPEGERVSCPRCGSDNDKNEHRCKICGEKLNKQTTVEIPVYSQQKISSAAPLPPQSNVPNPPFPGNLGSGVPPAGQGVGMQPPAMHSPQGAKVSPSAAPPPPIGMPGGGAVADQKVQFVPDWKQGKKAAAENAAQEKQAKPKGTFSKKTAMTIIFGIVAIIIVAVALIFLEKGGTSADKKSGSSDRSDANSSTSGSGRISEEEITDSGTSSLKTDTTNTQPSTPDLKGVQIDTNKTPINQSNISVVEDKNASEINDLITKGKDALKRGRVNYPRNNNAFYFFQQARDKGADTPEFEELKTQLNTSLHTLGDKKLGERSFKDANTFYDLAAQVDPDDTSIRRKKSQVRDMQRRTEIEQNELNAAIRTQTIAELEKFVDKYPTSPLAAQAQAEIVRLKRLKQETEEREAQRKKDEDARKAYEEKQYVFNVVHSYFMGKNRGKLIINRKGVLFEPVDNKNERFYATYGQIQSFVFDDGEVVIKFKQSIGEIGDEITLKHITEAEAKTKQIFDAYEELRLK